MSETENSFRIKKHNIMYWFITALCFGAFAFQLVYHSVRASATIDEPVHVLAGHRHLYCGDFGINPEHPPMAKMLATLPLQFQNLKEPPFDCGSRLTTKVELFLYGPNSSFKTGLMKLLFRRDWRLRCSAFFWRVNYTFFVTF